MRPILALLGISFLVLGQPLAGKCDETVFTEMGLLLQNNKIEEVVKLFDNIIEINILEKENYYSSHQGATILMDFFEKHPIDKLTILSSGGRRTSNYGTARIRCADTNYLMTIAFSSGPYKTYKIHQIKIEIEK